MKAFERAWRSAERYIEANHKPLSEKKKKRRKGKKKREKKEKHYWEYIPEIAKCLREGITGVRAISRKTGIPKSSISDIFKLVSREQILENEEEAINYLKSIQRGGKRASEEKLREGGKKRFEKYLEKELRKIEEKYKKKERGGKAKVKITEEKKAYIDKYFVKLELELPEYVWKLSKVSEVGGCPNRALIYYSLTENGREVVGKNALRDDKVQKKKNCVSDNITDEVLTSIEIERKKEERTERLVKSRQIYAKTWKTFKFVRNYLENQGVEVIDSRYKGSGTGLDGRKLLKLIRYLLTNEVKELNLAGWGRYAKALRGALLEAELIGSGTKVIMPKAKDTEELELEVLQRLGFSEEEIHEYQNLSEEGKLEYLEKRGKLKEYQELIENQGIGYDGGKKAIEEEEAREEVYDEWDEEIPF